MKCLIFPLFAALLIIGKAAIAAEPPGSPPPLDLSKGKILWGYTETPYNPPLALADLTDADRKQLAEFPQPLRDKLAVDIEAFRRDPFADPRLRWDLGRSYPRTVADVYTILDLACWSVGLTTREFGDLIRHPNERLSTHWPELVEAFPLLQKHQEEIIKRAAEQLKECDARCSSGVGFDWVGVVLTPIAIALIVGIYLGRLLAYQQVIASAVAALTDYPAIGSCKTYGEVRDVALGAAQKISACSLMLTSMKHVRAARELMETGRVAKTKIDAAIKASQLRAKAEEIPENEWHPLLAAITALANHASKRVASTRTPWWNYFRFRLITRKQLGIEGNEWPD